MTKVLVVATSRKTHGGIMAVVKAHETGEQWRKYHCRWIETHRDGLVLRKIWYLVTALVEYIILLPFYDIVHIHVGVRTSVTRKLLFAKIAKIYGKKIIIHFHPSTEKHLFQSEFSIKIKKLFDFSDKLVVLSPQWIKWIEQAFGENRYDMQVVLNPCPIVNRTYGERKSFVLYAGILNDRKGYSRLIEAFSNIASEFPNWQLLFAGNGEIEKGRELIKKLGINEKQIDFLGWVSGKEKDRLFNEASIFCLPSWGEGFPMGVLDAISYGIPVITTPVGGIEQVLHSGSDCLIFPSYDIKKLSECLSLLMESEQMRLNIVTEADKMKDSKFNIININNEISNIYAQISKR